MTDTCHKEECERRAVVVFYVRWTVRHQHYNLWKSCDEHADEMYEALGSGVWSGGVRPIELLEKQR